MNTEQLARSLCTFNGVNPDQEGTAVRDVTKTALGDSYKLWQYWEHFYVKPLIENMENEHA